MRWAIGPCIYPQYHQYRFKVYCLYTPAIMDYQWAEAWFSFIGDTNCVRLERLQRSATKIILPDHDYEDWLGMLCILYLSSFLFDNSYSHFIKILNDESHPLYSRLSFNSNRTSSRAKQVFRPKRCRTTKRSNGFWCPITIMVLCIILRYLIVPNCSSLYLFS